MPDDAIPAVDASPGLAAAPPDRARSPSASPTRSPAAQLAARRQAADRAGNGRGDGGQPHRGARGGRGAARARARRDASGGRRVRRAGCRAPAVPAGASTGCRRSPRCSMSWSCAPASRSRPPGSPPSAARLRRGAGSRAALGRSTRRSNAAKARSTRISPFIAPSPRRPATRNSPHFLEYLGRFIIPRQSIRVAAHRPEGQRAYLETFQREHVAICAAIAAQRRRRRRARRCAGISANSQERYRRLAAEATAAGP